MSAFGGKAAVGSRPHHDVDRRLLKPKLISLSASVGFARTALSDCGGIFELSATMLDLCGRLSDSVSNRNAEDMSFTDYCGGGLAASMSMSNGCSMSALPPKRTFAYAIRMSALGQTRTSRQVFDRLVGARASIAWGNLSRRLRWPECGPKSRRQW
jgi:hypothetical protein